MSLRATHRALHIARTYATRSHPPPRKSPSKPKAPSKPRPPPHHKPPPPHNHNHDNASQTLLLPDSRTLGYSTFGPPTGPTLLIFHGFPGSRLDAAEMVDPKSGIRVIGIDRPGIGLSSPQKHRKLTDWPADVLHLTRHLGIKTFRIMGGSAGGPYALTCAHAIPGDVLKATAVVAGFGPIEAGVQTMSKREFWFWRALPYLPFVLQFMTWWKIGRLLHHRNPIVRAKFMRGYAAEVGFEGGEVPREVVEILGEPFRQGVGGYVEDALVLFRHWGFRLEDVKARNVRFFNGEEDVNIPVRMGRYMAERLPYASIKTYPGETHFSLMENHGDEIVRELMRTGK